MCVVQVSEDCRDVRGHWDCGTKGCYWEKGLVGFLFLYKKTKSQKWIQKLSYIVELAMKAQLKWKNILRTENMAFLDLWAALLSKSEAFA